MRKTIAIVGNGQAPPGAAAMIDAADLVIRFNECGSYGRAGTRTDVLAVCNTGIPAKTMLGSAEWLSHPAVLAAAEIWSVRDPEKFALLRPQLAVAHPELDDFCDDYTAEFEALCAETGKVHRIVAGTIHEEIDRALSAFAPPPYVVPSSGMIVIGEVLGRFPDAEVTLAGFNHSGWAGHPFAAERKLVDFYVAAGRLKRLAATQSFPMPAET